MYLGAKSSRVDPDAYLEALINLYHHFQSNQPKGKPLVPLVVDTDGWIKGMGFDLLVHFIAAVSPDFVVCLEPPVAYNSEHSGIVVSREIEYSIPESINISISSVSSVLDVYSRSKLNDSDLRSLSLNAYFSQTVNDASKPIIFPTSLTPHWNFEAPVSHAVPYSVTWDDSLSVMIMHADVSRVFCFMIFAGSAKSNVICIECDSRFPHL